MYHNSNKKYSDLENYNPQLEKIIGGNVVELKTGYDRIEPEPQKKKAPQFAFLLHLLKCFAIGFVGGFAIGTISSYMEKDNDHERRS